MCGDTAQTPDSLTPGAAEVDAVVILMGKDMNHDDSSRKALCWTKLMRADGMSGPAFKGILWCTRAKGRRNQWETLIEAQMHKGWPPRGHAHLMMQRSLLDCQMNFKTGLCFSQLC